MCGNSYGTYVWRKNFPTRTTAEAFTKRKAA